MGGAAEWVEHDHGGRAREKRRQIWVGLFGEQKLCRFVTGISGHGQWAMAREDGSPAW